MQTPRLGRGGAGQDGASGGGKTDELPRDAVENGDAEREAGERGEGIRRRLGRAQCGRCRREANGPSLRIVG